MANKKRRTRGQYEGVSRKPAKAIIQKNLQVSIVPGKGRGKKDSAKITDIKNRPTGGWGIVYLKII